ncbi:unnamed protein product [Bemisia tabaci]|uniref:FHA domain-containing protein n=1 Tax=Bemisia tabaci TaxID=7038 RepID=A0A9P0F690_BEMTA|nr:unnamed protein product [Bemisia tabaci]
MADNDYEYKRAHRHHHHHHRHHHRHKRHKVRSHADEPEEELYRHKKLCIDEVVEESYRHKRSYAVEPEEEPRRNKKSYADELEEEPRRHKKYYGDEPEEEPRRHKKSYADESEEEPRRHKKLYADEPEEEPRRHKKYRHEEPDEDPLKHRKLRYEELDVKREIPKHRPSTKIEEYTIPKVSSEFFFSHYRYLPVKSDDESDGHKRNLSDESDDESSGHKNPRSRSKEKEKDKIKEEKHKKEDKSKIREAANEDGVKVEEKEKDRKKEKHKEKKKKKEKKERSRWQDSDENQRNPAQIKQEPGVPEPPGNSNLSKFEEKSGKLAEDTNTYNGVVIKYSEPPEARKPKRRWRLYPFKGDQSLPILHIHRQSAFLLGRERRVCDIPIDHPSCSKQHAALQYRLVPFTRVDGRRAQRIRLYIIDLESANGTYVNNQRIEPKKYVELLEKDVIKFGFSSREYVLLHEHSQDSEDDDDAR